MFRRGEGRKGRSEADQPGRGGRREERAHKAVLLAPLLLMLSLLRQLFRPQARYTEKPAPQIWRRANAVASGRPFCRSYQRVVLDF